MPPIERQIGWPVLGMMLGRKLLLLALIAGGNLLAGLGQLPPGLVMLLYQAVVISWTAGANRFAESFVSVAAANAAFMRVGLWETTAYLLICAVTLRKSFYVADSFSARAWSEVRSLRGLVRSRAERVLAGFSLLCLLVAAWEEASTRV